MRDAGIGAVAAGVFVGVVGCDEVVTVLVLVLVPVVDVVPVVAEYVVVGVPLGDEEGAAPVVVGPGLGVCGEDPQAAASSTPTARVVSLARPADVRTVAHLLRHVHCRANGSSIVVQTGPRRPQNVGRPAKPGSPRACADFAHRHPKGTSSDTCRHPAHPWQY